MPELKTIDEVAPILRVKPVTVRRLVAGGKLPFTKVGRRYCFTDEHIKAFIARNEGNVKTGSGPAAGVKKDAAGERPFDSGISGAELFLQALHEQPDFLEKFLKEKYP